MVLRFVTSANVMKFILLIVSFMFFFAVVVTFGMWACVFVVWSHGDELPSPPLTTHSNATSAAVWFDCVWNSNKWRKNNDWNDCWQYLWHLRWKIMWSRNHVKTVEIHSSWGCMIDTKPNSEEKSTFGVYTLPLWSSIKKLIFVQNTICKKKRKNAVIHWMQNRYAKH